MHGTADAWTRHRLGVWPGARTNPMCVDPLEEAVPSVEHLVQIENLLLGEGDFIIDHTGGVHQAAEVVAGLEADIVAVAIDVVELVDIHAAGLVGHNLIDVPGDMLELGAPLALNQLLDQLHIEAILAIDVDVVLVHQIVQHHLRCILMGPTTPGPGGWST